MGDSLGLSLVAVADPLDELVGLAEPLAGTLAVDVGSTTLADALASSEGDRLLEGLSVGVGASVPWSAWTIARICSS